MSMTNDERDLALAAVSAARSVQHAVRCYSQMHVVVDGRVMEVTVKNIGDQFVACSGDWEDESKNPSASAFLPLVVAMDNIMANPSKAAEIALEAYRKWRLDMGDPYPNAREKNLQGSEAVQ